MAKKTSSKAMRSRYKAKKTSPSVRYLRYDVINRPTPGTETSHFSDLAKDLSAVNRRLMRQGRMYHVKRITTVSRNTIAFGNIDIAVTGTSDQQNAGRISFSTAPESWSTQMAWKRGFESWKRMNSRVTENAGGDFKANYHDFKVYLSNDMRTGTVLTPIDNGGNAVSAGEWDYCEYVTPDGTTSADPFTAGLLGAQVGSVGSVTYVGLVQSYSDSRATVYSSGPNDDPQIDTDPLMNLFDDGTVADEILQNLQSDNDAPPYDAGQYPGGASNMPKPLVVQDTTLGADGKSTVGGFSAMCGLIEIESNSPIANDVYSVLVELAPGKYRGVKADVI